MNNYIASHQNASHDAFKQVEQNADDCVNSLDTYVASIYSNNRLLDDFLFYFGNTPEEYFTKRILNSQHDEYKISFIKDCKNYVSRNNYIVSKISFFNYSTVNTMQFRNDGSTVYNFCIDPTQLAYMNKVEPFSYTHNKELPNPSNLTSKIGQIQINIDLKKLFPIVENYDVKNASAICENELLPIVAFNNDDVAADYNLINISKANQGTLSKGFLNKIHYSVYKSEKYGFKIITMINTKTILKENLSTFLLSYCLIIVVFVLMAAIIAVRMNYDAKYIKQIINFIDNVKRFDFSQNKIIRRNDEFSMIANALNDMSDKINKHIEQEYLLKLDQQKAEMKALENQINPHFLYNTLEIIRSKSFLNGDEVVSNAIYNLGSMYRDIVKSEQIITFDAELEMLTKYLKLMEFKYEDNFYYQINVCPKIRELNTVKFWMQPIVENFFAHGFDKDNKYNLILIVGEEHDDSYVVEFVDNGSCIDFETLNKLNDSLCLNASGNETQSIGIANIYKRLRYYYGEKMSMNISNNKEAGITVKLEIKKESYNV